MGGYLTRDFYDSMLDLESDVCCTTCGPSEIEPPQSSTSVGCHRSPAHSRVYHVTHAASLDDVRIGIRYVRYGLEDGIAGLNNGDRCAVYSRTKVKPFRCLELATADKRPSHLDSCGMAAR